MKIRILAVLASLTSSVLAGGSGKAVVAGKGKLPMEAPAAAVATGCNCFAAGTQGFSLYAAAFVGAEHFDDNLGAGLSYSYFQTENVGVEVDGTWGFADSAIHTFNASLVLRAPIKGICLAPYALIGGGLHTDGVTEGTFHIGAGVDYRITPNCLGVFADARYTFAEQSGDYTVVRAGIRVNF
jgi:outer membrane protein W